MGKAFPWERLSFSEHGHHGDCIFPPLAATEPSGLSSGSILACCLSFCFSEWYQTIMEDDDPISHPLAEQKMSRPMFHFHDCLREGPLQEKKGALTSHSKDPGP